MSPKAAVHENRFAGAEMWFLSLATMVLAVGALLVIMWEPMALGLALGVGLLAVGARSLFVRVKESAHEKAEASSAVANAGLAMAAISIAPLLLFAFLWAALLVLLGVMWLLSAIGVI
jgi:hypothetical protein